MWDIDSINTLLDQFHSFEIKVTTPVECNTLIDVLNSLGFDCSDLLRAHNTVPYPFFRIRGHHFGGNLSWKDADKPHFTYEQFVSRFNLANYVEDTTDINNLDSVI